MSANRGLLQKADMTISDLVANGGMLQPEDGAMFLRKMIKEPTILRQARVVEMLAPSRKINKIGFANRLLRAATSGVALTPNQRIKPTTETLQLDTKEIIAQINLPYDVLEDNIERATTADNAASNARGPGGLKETLLAMIAERAALDLEELCLLSDKNYTSADPDDQAFMTLFDGWLKLAQSNVNSHIVDWQNGAVAKELFRNMKKALPKQYLRVLPQMGFWGSVDMETMWRDSLANRGTALGDATLTGSSAVPAYGIGVNGAAMMPDTKVLLTNPKNLILGVQRQFSMEFDKDIQARVYIVVLTARVAVQIEEADASVLALNVNVNA